MMQFIYNLFIGPFVGLFVLAVSLTKRFAAFMAVFVVIYAIVGVCVYATGFLQVDWRPTLYGNTNEVSLWVIELGGQSLYLDVLCCFWPFPAFIAFIGMVRAFNNERVEYTNLRSRPLATNRKGQSL